MSLDLPAYSRFFNTPLTKIEDKETYAVWDVPVFISNGVEADRTITLVVDPSYEGRPDLISYDYYGTVGYAWVIMAYNNVRNTLNWPKAGDVIRFPIDTEVTRELL